LVFQSCESEICIWTFADDVEQVDTDSFQLKRVRGANEPLLTNVVLLARLDLTNSCTWFSRFSVAHTRETRVFNQFF
jgi:hypothetical protein